MERQEIYRTAQEYLTEEEIPGWLTSTVPFIAGLNHHLSVFSLVALRLRCD